MAEPSTYIDKAMAAAEILTSRWFTAETPSIWVPNDYWRTPTICVELVELMQATGKSSYVDTIENARQVGAIFLTSCAFYDDLSVWGRFFTKAYRYLEGNASRDVAEPFLGDAKTVCEQLGAAWGDPCGGGIWWKRNPPSYEDGNFKAANASLGYAEVAIDLYAITGDEGYLDRALAAWKWLDQSGLIDDIGLVWGGLDQSCTRDPSNKPVIAQQGNPLGPLWGLYAATRDSSYLAVADRIVTAALSKMTWPQTSVFRTREDAEWQTETPEWRQAHSGPTLFKGIFARYLGAYARQLAGVDDSSCRKTAAGYADALKENADAVWSHYPSHVFGMDWHAPNAGYEPSSDDVINACLQYSGVAVLLAAAQTEPARHAVAE